MSFAEGNGLLKRTIEIENNHSTNMFDSDSDFDPEKGHFKSNQGLG